MSKFAVGFDRFATLVVGLILIAIGAGAIIWNTTLIPDLPKAITAPQLVDWSGQSWWKWAIGGLGIVIALLTVRWLFSHTPFPRARNMKLAGSGPDGSITASLGTVASAAAQELAENSGVHSAKGRALVNRGVRTIELDVTLVSASDFGPVTAVVDGIAGDVAYMTGDPTVAVSTVFHFDKARRNATRTS